jgi:uvrABC system protein C
VTDPTTYRPTNVPTDPGVYKFRDPTGRVIYVGKAKNLRARLATYFHDLTQLHPRTRHMVTTANQVEWTVVGSEVEALQLEYTWIKKYDPHFNVKYRDDKTYPSLAISIGEPIPRAFFHRGPRKSGIRYFGPYSHAWAVRETLDLLIRIFPVRTCTKGVCNRHEKLGRPCLLGYIDKCSAPCVGRITETDHRRIVDDLCAFLAGRTSPITTKLETEMQAAAAELDFERAARIRDNLAAITALTEQQAIVLPDGTDADVIAIDTDDLEAAIQLFHIRAGRVKGQRGWVVERTDDHAGGSEQLMQDFLIRFYSDAADQEQTVRDSEEKAIKRRGVDNYVPIDTTATSVVPHDILVEIPPADIPHTEAALSQLRGGPVRIKTPKRGDKKTLMTTVHRNATEALKQHKLKRVGDLTARSAALQELQNSLFLPEAPLRIECTDISHIQGTDVVASLVVFEDGLPKKSDYRRYKITDAAGDGHSDDVASIAEVTRRRFLRHHLDSRTVPELDGSQFEDENPQTSNKFAYPPQLFIVDGGAPQVAAAQQVLDELGITDVPVIGIAKRLEEIWVAGEEYPLILPRHSQALFLIQHIRDEAHRFAITYHRQQRSARMRRSELDNIKGLGAARRTELVKHFGSVKQLRQASVADITAVKGFGPQLAQNVYDALHPPE